MVGEAVGLVGQRRLGAHREGERLVLLDQVEEALAAQRAHRARVGDVGGPPGRGDEAVAAADLDARRLAAERRPRPGRRGRRGRCRTRPAAASRAAAAATGSTVTIRTRAPRSASRRARLSLRDVAAEEVLEVDRRDQQVDPLRRVVADGELAAARSSSRGRARAARRVRGRGAGLRAPVAAGWRRAAAAAAALGRARVDATSRRRQANAEAAGRTSAPSVSRPSPAQLARAAAQPGARARQRAVARAAKRSSARRLAGAMRSPQRIWSTVANCSEPADVHEVVHPPAAGRARAGPRRSRAQPVAQRACIAVGARRGPAPRCRAARSRRAGGRRRRCRPRASAVDAPASGRGSARTGPGGNGSASSSSSRREQRGGAGHRVGHQQRRAGPCGCCGARAQ